MRDLKQHKPKKSSFFPQKFLIFSLFSLLRYDILYNEQQNIEIDSIRKLVLFVYRNVLKIEGQSLNIITREEIRAKFEEKVNNSTVLSEKDKKELL